jgi:hypothetical protein
MRLGSGAVRVSAKVKRALRRGRSRKLALRVKQTPVAGPETSTRATFKVKGRR